MDFMRTEALLRACATLLLLTTACLIRFDTQTSLIFPSFSRTATFRDINALYVLVFIDIATAVYNLIQLVIKGLLSSHVKPDMNGSYKYIAWLSFLFDQLTSMFLDGEKGPETEMDKWTKRAVVYMLFASNSAGLTASLFAVTGEHDLFWMKLCNKFDRFCAQVAGALLCGFATFLLMAMVSSLSAYGVFRYYSPKSYLVLK